MNNPDHISKSFETIFLGKILKFFDADSDLGSGIFLTLDPGSGMEKIGSKNPGCLSRIRKTDKNCEERGLGFLAEHGLHLPPLLGLRHHQRVQSCPAIQFPVISS
jgi:hypothetical protein